MVKDCSCRSWKPDWVVVRAARVPALLVLAMTAEGGDIQNHPTKKLSFMSSRASFCEAISLCDAGVCFIGKRACNDVGEVPSCLSSSQSAVETAANTFALS